MMTTMLEVLVDGARAVAEAAAAMDTEVALLNSNAVVVVGWKMMAMAGAREVVATAEAMAAVVVEWIMAAAVEGAWA